MFLFLPCCHVAISPHLSKLYVMAEQLVVAAVRGGGVPWTFLESFPRTVEMDDTFKLIYEVYSVTLVGQTDGDRVFHTRGVGISTKQTALTWDK